MTKYHNIRFFKINFCWTWVSILGILYYCPPTKLVQSSVGVQMWSLFMMPLANDRSCGDPAPPPPSDSGPGLHPALPRRHGDFTIQGPPPQNPDTWMCKLLHFFTSSPYRRPLLPRHVHTCSLGPHHKGNLPHPSRTSWKADDWPSTEMLSSSFKSLLLVTYSCGFNTIA